MTNGDSGSLAKPDWLTNKLIDELRNQLREYPKSLSDEELSHWQYDGYNDIKGLNTRRAYEILSHFGLLEEQEGDHD